MVCLCWAVATATAQNFIEEWGHQPGIDYEIVHADHAVVIRAPGAYKFQATDPNGPQGLGHIESVTIDPSVTGGVSLWILRDPNDVQDPNDPNQLWGAADIDLVDLPRTGGRVIVEVRVLNALAADGDVTADTVGSGGGQAGGIFVGGNILNDIRIGHLRESITCGSMRDLITDLPVDPNVPIGDIYIAGPYNGTISINNSVASIVIDGDFGGVVDITGDLMSLEIYGDRNGLVNVARGLPYFYHAGYGGGAVHVGHDLGHFITWSPDGDFSIGGCAGSTVGCYFYTGFAGHMEFPGDSCGGLYVHFWLSGDVVVHGNHNLHIELKWPYGDLTGRIVVDGDWLSWLSAEGEARDPNGALSGGQILIKGSLGGPLERPAIWFRNGFAGSTEFICVDYNGGDPNDTWVPGYCIQFGDPGDPNNPCYDQNTPERHVWETSPCKGDLDGSWTVDFEDINPFVLALSSPSGYSQYFPGLGGTASDDYVGGSRVWHADLDCDGSLDFADINPFVALLSMAPPPCDPSCPDFGDEGDGPAGGGGESLDPEHLAAMLAENIWPELYDDLLAVVLQAIETARDQATQAYWEAVYAALP